MAGITLILWRDIPAQLLLRDASGTRRRVLSPRFAEAIDRAAMRGGARDEEAYLAGWRRAPCDVAGLDLDAAAAGLEAAYDDARLDRLVEAGGVA